MVPCGQAGGVGCNADNANTGGDDVFVESPQINPAAPDKDCEGFACEAIDYNTPDDSSVTDYGNADDSSDYTDYGSDGDSLDATDCTGDDCGNVDDAADYQPDRAAPEFGCNGGACSSPEEEQGLEIEPVAEGPCGDGKCDESRVAKL